LETIASIYTRILFPDPHSKTESPQLSDLQKAMLDVTPDCIKVLSIDGNLLTMNKAGCLALNVPCNSEFGMPWIPLLPETVHQSGYDALQKAVAGNAARFAGQSNSPGGTAYWDNLLTPVKDATGHVLSILCVSRDVTENALLERELEEAVQREKLVSQEMRHRIKNLFSVVMGLISISEREAAGENAPDTAMKILREKLGALSRASDTAFAMPEIGTAPLNSVDVHTLLHSVLQPYRNRYRLCGEQIFICQENITTLALYLHELATNSIKYGSLGADGGSVKIECAKNEKGLELSWTESGGPEISAIPAKKGFGSEMVERIIGAAGGSINKLWLKEGFTAKLLLPNPGMERLNQPESAS